MAQIDDPGPPALEVRVGSVPVDAATVDALARLQLIAKRLGRQVVLLEAGEELRALIAYCGLSEVLPVSPGSGPGPGLPDFGQPEEREDPLVQRQEEADPGDLAV